MTPRFEHRIPYLLGKIEMLVKCCGTPFERFDVDEFERQVRAAGARKGAEELFELHVGVLFHAIRAAKALDEALAILRECSSRIDALLEVEGEPS